METIVRIDGFDVESKEFSFLTSDDKGQGRVGTEDVPENISEESKDGSESIKGEKEEEDANHTIF